jgi:hypothetical protein
MQKIFGYEMAVAMKDRPKIFQIITLVLFSFSVTVIVVSSLAPLAAPGHEKQTYKPVKVAGYAGFVAAPAGHILHLKK